MQPAVKAGEAFGRKRDRHLTGLVLDLHMGKQGRMGPGPADDGWHPQPQFIDKGLHGTLNSPIP